MPSPTQIGIAVVEHQSSYLVGVRSADGPLAGYAEFPGGKCLPGESPRDCAVRECLEETGLEVIAESLLLERKFEYPHGTVHLHFWRCRPNSEASPRDPFRWISAAALRECKFPEANESLLALL